MDNRELENRIKSSYENIAPDILESVLSDCDTQKGRVIVMQKKKRKNTFVKYVAGMAAALLLAFGGMSFYQGNHAIASTVMLDVNPSIEIQVNKGEKVLGVKALNEDAKIVVGDMDFSGSSLDVTVNALIGSMLRNGYISDAANSILVTVDNSDPTAGQALQTRLMAEINTVLESGNVSGAVLGQTVTHDSETEQLAAQYGITVGKAKLIREITQQNTLYSFADLVPLTINELNLISESGGTKLENIESIGTASSSAYIGEQAAKDAAFNHAGVSSADVVSAKCELDWERGMMVYEVDFDTADLEYEYEINAKTGEIVRSGKEKNDDFPRVPTVPASNANGDNTSFGQAYIDEAAAKMAALSHAGVSDIWDYECELDYERGKTIYEISFKAGGYEYDYKINAADGTILKYDKERD